MQKSKKKFSEFYKRLKGLSLKNLHAELNRIWLFIESFDERLKKLEGNAGVMVSEDKNETITGDSSGANVDKELAAETFNSITSDVTPENTGDNQGDKVDADKAVRDAAFARAKELGLNPHHKTGTDKVLAMIEEKEKEGSVE